MRCTMKCFPTSAAIRTTSNSFRPERVLFRHGGVNLRACLCGIQSYASAQSLDFLARTKNPSFPNRKLVVSHPEFPDGNYLAHFYLSLISDYHVLPIAQPHPISL